MAKIQALSACSLPGTSPGAPEPPKGHGLLLSLTQQGLEDGRTICLHPTCLFHVENLTSALTYYFVLFLSPH